MTPNPPQRSSRAAWIVAGVLVVVIALVAVIAIVASGGGDDDGSTATTVPGGSEVRPVAITGDPLPPFGDSPDPAVGLAAPAIEGAGFDGSPVSVDPGSGRVTVVVFLAHWCPHCQREVPVLTGWEAEGGLPEGVDVISVATATAADRPNYPPSSWLAGENWPFPVIADDPSYTAGQAYGLSSFPYFVILDADGNVSSRASGEIDPDDLATLIDQAGA
jgi:cytochrome c biogenesis protein CcmG/thiol:disulfide interchange protein DsbE